MSAARKALVTGASGFIGSHLVPRLVADGWEVTIVVRPSSRIPQWTNDDQVHQVVYGDDPLAFAEAVTQAAPDVCFHLATYFTAAHQPAELAPLLDGNIAFGTHLADALSHLEGVTFVNVGTVWQHYESRQYSPVSLYAATKQAFADIAQYYAECTSLQVVNLELTDSYGPGDERKKLLRLLLDASESGEPMLLSGGEQYFDVVHVDDAVAALIHAVHLASHEAPSFAVRADNPPTLRQFVESVSAIIDKPIPVDWGARPYRPREMMTPWQYTAKLPNWSPTITLESGLSAMLDSGHNPGET